MNGQLWNAGFPPQQATLGKDRCFFYAWKWLRAPGSITVFVTRNERCLFTFLLKPIFLTLVVLPHLGHRKSLQRTKPKPPYRDRMEQSLLLVKVLLAGELVWWRFLCFWTSSNSWKLQKISGNIHLGEETVPQISLDFQLLSNIALQYNNFKRSSIKKCDLSYRGHKKYLYDLKTGI